MLTLLLLAATPVSLQLELSEATRARVGLRVKQVVEQRLGEEGFELKPGARVKLLVEELHGTLRLSATVGTQVNESVLKPSGAEWRDELALELAQRLCSLAHEAALIPPASPELAAQPRVEPQHSEPPPPEPPPSSEPTTTDVRPPSQRYFGAGFRVGITARPPAVDPGLSFIGFLATGVLQPMVSMGLTIAPAPTMTVFEVPVLLGLRAPIALGDFALTPELLGGARLHLTDSPRVEVMGTVGLTFTRAFGPVKVGLRVGLDVGSTHEHVLGADVLWSRGIVGVGGQLHIER